MQQPIQKKLTDGVEEALSSGGVDAAKEFCRNTKGPVASIFYQGLDRMDEGVESAEKAVVAYGGIVLACLILGLAIAIERIIYLNFATTNTEKLVEDIESALKSGGVDSAKEICRNTPGPVASIFYQGLDRAGEGVESAEKAVVAYGGVQMGQLEKNVSWISLFIALAPMLGFMGTVIGMIQAFDKIQAAGDMQPSLVAGGIKVALLTTVFGLIVAIILQIFYNYIVAKIDSIVNDMEDASITLIDILVSHKK